MSEPDVHDAALAAALKAFASPSRITLLRQLRNPRILSDIRVVPAPAADGDSSADDRPDRPIARQAVRKHLEKLMEAGFVRAHSVERAFGETLEYVVNHQRIFAVSEEIRELAHLRPVDGPIEQPTVEDARRANPVGRFPRLLTVRGLNEGTAVPLQVRAHEDKHAWVIGRKRGVAIVVDYDPFVSLENTQIRWQDGQYLLEDLPQSRNGTTLNFERLSPTTSVPLHHGDVIGVGRTLFVFQTHAGQPEDAEA